MEPSLSGTEPHSPGVRRALRLIVHDYGGYPFIAQLSRELSARGHEVLHLYAAGFRQPKGPTERREGDPATLAFAPVALNEPLRRGGIRRIPQELRYGRLLADHIGKSGAQAVLSANSPLDVQAAATEAAHEIGAASIFWLQDLYSVAITLITGRRFPLAGSLIGVRFRRLEQRLLRQSDAVVAASPDFLPILREWAVPMKRVYIVENWAPVEGEPSNAEVNAWASQHGIPAARVVALYAGTLALKHNPGYLLALARGLPEVLVVVVAHGPGADWLRARGGSLENLLVLPPQPYDDLPLMLARSSLLIALLEPDASQFSVPSKVLTYFAAGRAILAAIPESNLAARNIRTSAAGVVADPGNPEGLVAAARQLLADPGRLQAAGDAGREFARRTFNIQGIAEQFEAILYRAVDRKSHSGTAPDADTGEPAERLYEAGH